MEQGVHLSRQYRLGRDLFAGLIPHFVHWFLIASNATMKSSPSAGEVEEPIKTMAPRLSKPWGKREPSSTCIIPPGKIKLGHPEKLSPFAFYCRAGGALSESVRNTQCSYSITMFPSNIFTQEMELFRYKKETGNGTRTEITCTG